MLLRQIWAECPDLSECGGICIGAAGVSNPRVKVILEQSMEAAGMRAPWRLCGDQEIALRGAMDTPGLVVIAGTGSICFGKNEKGQMVRSGGFGHLIDDGGSGYALGRDALAASVRYVDGRGNGKKLSEQVFQTLKIHSAEELVQVVYSSNTHKSDIAKLAKDVLDLARQEDEIAMEILRREAEELVCMVRAVQKRLAMYDCPIALLGGLLADQNPYRQVVEAALAPYGRIQRPNQDALWGAAQMAWELSQQNRCR